MKSMILFSVILSAFSFTAMAHSIEGKWQTIDDETKKPKAIVQIVENNGVYNGKIIAMAQGVADKCANCSYKNSLIGLRVVKGLKADGDKYKYKGGEIFDPKSGNTYQSKASLSADGKVLEVRGFVGISVFGRTQTWQRVE